MSGRGILDADMRGLGRWAVRGWRWWLGELAALVPAVARRGRGDRSPRLGFAGDRLDALTGRVRPGARTIVVVPEAAVLRRTVERPRLGERDLHHLLALDAEALLPFPPEDVLIAGRPAGPGLTPGRMRIELAGLPLAAARAIAAAAEAAAIVPWRIVVEGVRAGTGPIDFAPAMRTAGILPPRRSAAPLLWGLVAGLVAAHGAALIRRDAATVDRLAQRVAAQQPAVEGARAIARRIAADRALVAASLARRRGHAVLADLATVSATLPEGAWLQRYGWDGSGVRLTGYRPPRTDVAAALRRSGRFAAIRSLADETQATVPAGDPFDLSARFVRR